jgi:hypothetical protein
MDYADVPPTRGTYKGAVKSELSVSVGVEPSETLPPLDEERRIGDDWVVVALAEPDTTGQQGQQQQQ